MLTAGKVFGTIKAKLSSGIQLPKRARSPKGKSVTRKSEDLVYHNCCVFGGWGVGSRVFQM